MHQSISFSCSFPDHILWHLCSSFRHGNEVLSGCLCATLKERDGDEYCTALSREPTVHTDLGDLEQNKMFLYHGEV